jgi:hypothetical protein
MDDSRLPLTIRSVADGFAIVFADGGQHVFVSGREPTAGTPPGGLNSDEALELAKEIARALIAAWGDRARSGR